MNSETNETWRAIAGKVAARLLLLLAFYPVVFYAAFLATCLFFFAHEHPFHTNGQPDYEKVPAAMGTFVAIPVWFLFGLIGGCLTRGKTSRPVRVYFLFALQLLLTGASLFLPGAFWTEIWPAWVPALAFFLGVLLLSRPFAPRNAS